MFCSMSQFGDDFTIQSMFSAARTVVLLSVKRRGGEISIEFEEDAVGLKHITGTFKMRHSSDALDFVKKHMDDFREGNTSLGMRDFELVPRHTTKNGAWS